MKYRVLSIVLVSFVLIFSGALSLDSGQINPDLIKSKVKLTKLPDRYIKGIVFEDGVSTGIANKYVGIYLDNCKRVYVSLENSVVGSLRFSFPFNKVKIKISGGSFFLLDKASNTNNKIPGLSISVLRSHTFSGRVTVVNCRDHYFEMRYRLCDYGTYTARVNFPSVSECSFHHLAEGDRVKVASNEWTYSPVNSLFTLNKVVSVKKL